jgi:Zn-dependent membrane protease YugP
MKKFILNYIEDILILSGLAVIIATTFLLSKIAGLYSLGVILFGLGVYFARNPLEKR